MSADPLGDPPPAAIEAEQALLGACLLSPTAVTDARHALIGPGVWQRPAHETIWAAIQAVTDRGGTPDPITVYDALGVAGPRLGATYLHELAAACPTPATAPHYARIVINSHRRRLRWELAAHARQVLTDSGPDAYDQLLRDHLQAAAYDTDTPTLTTETIADLLAGEDPDHDWIVPNLLERRDRLILTGPEGGGKSTWLRQTAVQLAAGVHPTSPGELITPLRVLVVDLENSRTQNRRAYRGLASVAHHRGNLDPDRLRIVSRPEGLDLTKASDVDWLTAALRDARPDVLVTGPIYKLAAGNPNDEVDAKPVALTLDRLRAEHDIAVLLEAHSKKAEGHDPRKRSIEPFGWSGWLRWPEIGIHLSKEGTIAHWRGMRDAERRIPEGYQRGGDWPWSPYGSDDGIEYQWAKVMAACETAGEALSVRAIEAATGISRSGVQRIKEKKGMAWAAFMGRFGGKGAGEE